jgi:hypothetical protein
VVRIRPRRSRGSFRVAPAKGKRGQSTILALCCFEWVVACPRYGLPFPPRSRLWNYPDREGARIRAPVSSSRIEVGTPDVIIVGYVADCEDAIPSHARCRARLPSTLFPSDLGVFAPACIATRHTPCIETDGAARSVAGRSLREFLAFTTNCDQALDTAPLRKDGRH